MSWHRFEDPCGPGVRRRLAEALERAVDSAHRPRRPLTPTVPVDPEAGTLARAALLDLAERLRQPRPVTLAGMRMVHALVTNGAGPLYVTRWAGQLETAAERALQHLNSDSFCDRRPAA